MGQLEKKSEVFKYPYCGSPIQDEEFFSEKICLTTISLKKIVVKKTKWLMVCIDVILKFRSGMSSTVPLQSIGFSILPTSEITQLMSSIYSESIKKIIICQFCENNPEATLFTDK